MMLISSQVSTRVSFPFQVLLFPPHFFKIGHSWTYEEESTLSEIDKRLQLLVLMPCTNIQGKAWLNSLLYINTRIHPSHIIIADCHRSPVISGTRSIWGKSSPSLWFETFFISVGYRNQSQLQSALRLTGQAFWMKTPHPVFHILRYLS